MKKHIKNWINESIIDEQTANRLEEYQNKVKNQRLNIIAYSIAFLLMWIGITVFSLNHLAAISSVLHHNSLKVLLVTIPSILCFWGGYYFTYEKQSNKKLGNTLLASSMFGIVFSVITIFSVFKFYTNDFVIIFLWLICTSVIAYKTKNRAINFVSIFAFILFLICFYNFLSIDTTKVWTIFIPIISGTALYTLANLPIIKEKAPLFSLDYKIFGAIMSILTLLILVYSAEPSYKLVSAFYWAPVATLMIINAINFIIQRKKPNAAFRTETLIIELLLAFLLLALLSPFATIPLVIICPNLFVITLILLAKQFRLNTVATWLLITYVTTFYCSWGWFFLGKTAFFVIGGILVFLARFLPTHIKALKVK